MSDDWYSRDVRAAIKGMMHLTLEERGAYNTLIDHQYLLNGPLPDDDRYIAGLMGCDLRIWKRIKTSLLAKGRIVISDGHIADERASYTIAKRQAARKQAVASGHAGGISSGISRKNKAVTEGSASTPAKQIRREEKREDTVAKATGGKPPDSLGLLRKDVWDEGKALLCEALDLSDNAAGGRVTQWVQASGNNLSVVLTAIRECRATSPPPVNPATWVMARVSTKSGKGKSWQEAEIERQKEFLNA